MTGSTLPAPSHQPSAQPGNRPYKHPFQASVLWMPDAQCSLLPNALKHGFYSRRFSNRSFYNRSFYNRSSRGQEHLDLEFLVYRPSSIVRRLSSFFYRPIIRSSSFRDFFLLKNIRH